MRERGEMLTFEEDDVRVAWVHALLHGCPTCNSEVSLHFPPICFSLFWAERGERGKKMREFGPFLDLVLNHEAQNNYFSAYWAFMGVHGPKKPNDVVYDPLGFMKLVMGHHGPLEIRWIIIVPYDPKYPNFMDVGPIRSQIGFLGPK